MSGTTERLNYDNRVTARFTGKTVYPTTNLVTNLLYVRHCILSTTGGPKLVGICENGETNVGFWRKMAIFDCLLHYGNYILLIIFCAAKANPPNSHNIWFWIGVFGPVLLHCLILLYSICTLGMHVSSALKFALLFHVKTKADIAGMQNRFIEFSSHTKLSYEATQDQEFYFGILVQSTATLDIMLYSDGWKRSHIDFIAYFHNFSHMMIVIEVIFGAVLGLHTSPTYLVTYIVFIILSQCMRADCENGWKAIGMLGECLLHIIFCPLVCCCRCCCVLSTKAIKARAQENVNLKDASDVTYTSFPGDSCWFKLI